MQRQGRWRLHSEATSEYGRGLAYRGHRMDDRGHLELLNNDAKMPASPTFKRQWGPAIQSLFGVPPVAEWRAVSSQLSGSKGLTHKEPPKLSVEAKSTGLQIGEDLCLSVAAAMPRGGSSSFSVRWISKQAMRVCELECREFTAEGKKLCLPRVRKRLSVDGRSEAGVCLIGATTARFV